MRTSLVRTLADAVRAWWLQDDIRVSPYEGRLLALDVPCILEVEGRLFEILRRTIGRSSAGRFVAYSGHAAADGSDCECECRPGSSTVEWSDDRGTRSLDVRNILVFCPVDRH